MQSPDIGKAPSDRKRKLSSRTPATQWSPADNVAVSNEKQRTISELFSNSQQKPISRDANGPPRSPNSKRVRLSAGRATTQSDFPSSPPQGLSEAISPEKMYTFTSKAPSKDNIVDLTESPAASPRRNGLRNSIRPSLNPLVGGKKIVVKNLRTQARTDPREYFNQVWEKLDAALAKIFNNDKIAYSLEELYRSVENVCRQGHAKELSEKLQQRCEELMNDRVRQNLMGSVRESSVEFLRAVLKAWTTWRTQMKQIYWIWCYMDRSFLLPKGQSLQDAGYKIFRNKIIGAPQFQPKIIDGACDLVSADREGEMQSQLFRDAVEMFHEIGVYTSLFEPRLLEQSQTYIVDWAEQAGSEKALADYVDSSLELIRRETNRCELFSLDSSTKRNLMTLLDDHLVSRKVSKLTEKDGVHDLLDQNAVEDLRQLYSFLERRSFGENLKPAFIDWVDLTGTTVVFDGKEQDQMVVKLICLKQQLDRIWKTSFRRDERLGYAMRKTFESFMNKTKKTSATWGTDNSKPEEMIAKYLDLLLRGGAKAIPAALSKTSAAPSADEDEHEEVVVDEDSEVNNQLDQVLDLFRFVHGKAVFEAFYKKDLARRLLMGRSASADAERNMLTRLKTECGAGFTANLEQMFKDIELAREEMTSYKSLLEEREGRKPALDLSVNILSQAAWPSYPEIPVIIPVEIKKSIDKFETNYKSKHSGRKLEWKHALAHCQLKAAFPKGSKELVVSSFQAIVLLHFNGRPADEHVTYDYLKSGTGLPEAELKRTLQSLACARLRPLTKHPKGREIDETDTFTFNTSFTDPKYRVKINTVQLKETAQENKETHERVQADRHLECQAAIVRILKSRKRITHQELIAETISATKKRGVMSVSDIKRNLDRLIEKEYCEREDGNVYAYIA